MTCCVFTLLLAVEDAVLLLTVNVDEDTAPSLNNGHDQLEDILVLHLEKGKDFFITVTGNYLPSCFGSSLETLVHLHTYIREVPVAQLVDLVCSTSTSVQNYYMYYMMFFHYPRYLKITKSTLQ